MGDRLSKVFHLAALFAPHALRSMPAALRPFGCPCFLHTREKVLKSTSSKAMTEERTTSTHTEATGDRIFLHLTNPRPRTKPEMSPNRTVLRATLASVNLRLSSCRVCKTIVFYTTTKATFPRTLMYKHFFSLFLSRERF